ncbi:unnamed protein product (macronuclear) [Paramecium tetraurelia]|uniref:AMP-dependent synthetase/ligase domain-containing protein n=1 Tax=Paramecium tetraurelia TaxID=5888 RepID=A0CJW2_PARTE|nr:uncharacterized protein GSPATT00000791001 [Paramecium tetraurelia]CAK71079.1 unnamed protein product [Paramecium tetraurelia]|eukprot:XP_001438476.1 hypothetical protein (macronuclear) [Paramecium tetraurelia strain d4-2]
MGQAQSLIYAVPVGEKKEGESNVYRNPTHVAKLLDNFEGEKTVQGMFLRACRLYPENRCIGKQITTGQNSKHYKYMTYKEVKQDAEYLGSGIINLNLIPKPEVFEDQQLKMIGVFSKNREEWLILDIANTLYGNTMIPLYETLGFESLPYIFEQTQLNTLFISESNAQTILKVSNYHALKNIICFDELSQEIIEKFNQKGLKVMPYEQVIQAGKAKVHAYFEVTENNIFTFSYTSGTTGLPKGVMLRHKNFVSVSGGVVFQGIVVSQKDVYLSYLPLPHVLERFVVITLLGYGSTICMYGGDVQKLNQDLQMVKPTLFMSVPRLYFRIYTTIKQKLESLQGAKKKLCEQALSSKQYYLKNGGHVEHRFWDNMVFNKTKEALGGRVRYMLSGSAPMSAEVIDFLKCVICAPFIEGYGQTEGCGGSFITKAEDSISGHVGGVFPNIEFKVIDVPEMNYHSTDVNENNQITPRGEICLRGNAIFAGYYKEEEKTKEMIDKDGWIHSGDVGVIRPNGALQIIDRVKNIFKLSQGEYIAPEKIEGIYQRVNGVTEAFVYGDSSKSYCIGFIVPDKQFVLNLGNQFGLNQTFEELCKNKDIVKYFLDQVTRQGKLEKLNGLENVKQLYLEPISFIVHGLTSNTLKLMRHKAKAFFANQINELYSISE